MASLKKVPTSVRGRVQTIDLKDKYFNIYQQCEMLGLSRASYYYKPDSKANAFTLALIMAVMKINEQYPYFRIRTV